MMPLFSLFFLAISLTACLASSTFNVRDFGAKGDGKVDDTAAIQRAINAAGEIARNNMVRVGHVRHIINGISERPRGEVVFPAGHYLVSKPLVVASPVNLRGIEEALLEQTSPESDIFYFHSIAQARVEGISLRGGRIQLRFWTNNIGPADIGIKGCRFVNAGGYAIECRSYYTTKSAGEEWSHSDLTTIRPWAPYKVDWKDGQPTLSPQNAENIQEWFNSTLISVSDCEFVNCRGAADMQCDTAVIRDCRIEGGRKTSGPIFNLPGGKTHLYRITGVAKLDPGNDAYWIEGGGILSADELDLDADGENGMDFIRVSGLNRTTIDIGGFCIDVQNSRIKTGGSRHNALCWFSKGTQPSILSISDVTETSGMPVQAAVWEEEHTEESLAKLLPPNNIPDLKKWFRIQIGINSGNIEASLSPLMATLVESGIPADILEKTHIPRLTWGFSDLEKDAKQVIRAESLGLTGERMGDVTSIIQGIFDKATQGAPCVVRFPAGVFRISKTIQLPANVTVIADGRALFEGASPEKDLFEVRDAGNIGFKGFSFIGGRNAFNFHNDKNNKARIAFSDCSFYDQENAGIQHLGKAGDVEISLQGGVIFSMRALVADAARTQVDGMWFINDPHLDNAAFVENRGGAMRIENCLANPKIWRGKRNKRPESLKSWEPGVNTRWVDNRGRLYLLNNRFGGESGGMANVFQREGGGTVFIGGGTTRFFNGDTTPAILHLESNAPMAVLQNISAVPVSVEGASAIIPRDAVKMNPDKFHLSCVFAPGTRLCGDN